VLAGTAMETESLQDNYAVLRDRTLARLLDERDSGLVGAAVCPDIESLPLGRRSESINQPILHTQTRHREGVISGQPSLSRRPFRWLKRRLVAGNSSQRSERPNHLHQPPNPPLVRLRQHPVPKVEDMPRPPAGLVQYPPRLRSNRFLVAQQHYRI